MKSYLKATLGAITAGLISASCLTVAQAQTTQLRFSHWVPTTHPIHGAIVDWAKSVEAASDNSLKVQVFPAQQLGQAKDHYDMARDGIVDVAFVAPGYSPGRFPVLGASELPFMISNAKEQAAPLNDWYDQYKGKEMEEVMACFVLTHAPGQFHAKKRIGLPEDVKGMNIRSGNAIMAKLMYQLGANNIQVSAAEAREVIERGAADAMTFLWNSVVLYGLDKSLKFHMDESFYVTTFAIVMNKQKYDRMTPQQKKAIDENCNGEAAKLMATSWSDWELAGRDVLAARSGHTLYKLTDAERSAWEGAIAPLEADWKQSVSQTGRDADAVIGDLRSRLEAQSAGD